MTLRANLVFPGKSPRNISEKTNILFRILLYYPCIVLIFAYTYNKKDEMGSGPLWGGVGLTPKESKEQKNAFDSSCDEFYLITLI